jgi:hypothetical protein
MDVRSHGDSGWSAKSAELLTGSTVASPAFGVEASPIYGQSSCAVVFALRTHYRGMSALQLDLTAGVAPAAYRYSKIAGRCRAVACSDC